MIERTKTLAEYFFSTRCSYFHRGISLTNKYQSSSLFKTVIDNLRELEDGQLAAPFLEVPSRKLYPDYYKEIKEPISLEEIETNLDSYATADDLIDAFDLMMSNAIAYNGEETQIAQDARRIRDFVQSQLDDGVKQEEEEMEEEDEGIDQEQDENFEYKEYLKNLKEQEHKLIDDLISYKARGRKVAEIFMDEPSRELYPHYYEIVQDPTSINTVLKQIDGDRSTNTIDGFADAVQLIFDNAKLFNEESSQVYADAVILEKQFNNKLNKLREAFVEPSGYSEWVQSVEDANEEDDEEEEDEGEDEQEEEDLEATEEALREERLKHFVDEQRRRDPGKTQDDALIDGVNITSMVPSTNAQQRYVQGRLSSGITPGGPPVNPAMANLFQISFPASKTHIVQSYAVDLPTYHHTINMSVVMHKSCHSRIYNLMVHHNSTRRVVPISSSSTNPWNDINKPLVDKFEIRLQPGLNKIEVVLQAGPIQRGPVRHVTQQLPSEGREEEKYIIWAMLQKAVGP